MRTNDSFYDVEDEGKKRNPTEFFFFLSHLAYSPELKYALIFPMLEAYSKGITHLPLLTHVIVASYCIMNVPRLNDLNICF